MWKQLQRKVLARFDRRQQKMLCCSIISYTKYREIIIY